MRVKEGTICYSVHRPSALREKWGGGGAGFTKKNFKPNYPYLI